MKYKIIKLKNGEKRYQFDVSHKNIANIIIPINSVYIVIFQS